MPVTVLFAKVARIRFMRMFLGCVAVLTLALWFPGCGKGGDGGVPVATVAQIDGGARITGNRVEFSRSFAGLDSVGMLVRVSNLPEGFTATVEIESASGAMRTWQRASLPGKGMTLAYNGTDLFGVAPFNALEFSAPLPDGAVVEIVDANAAVAPVAGARAAFIGFRRRFDINNDQVVNTSDLAMVAAWIQTSRTTDLALIKSRALELFSSTSGGVATLPAVLGEDLNDDGSVTSADIALTMAWIQCGRLSDATLVYNRAREISTLVTASPTKFPGEIASREIPNLIEADLGGGVKMQFVPIPSGTFVMGDPSYATPLHNVAITKSFWMSIYEVTQEQYQQVMAMTNPSYFQPYPKRPVEQISWNMAAAFCNTLSDQQGLSRCYSIVGTETFCDFSQTGYRLPTEAEWEYACRAGSGAGVSMAYYWGENIDGNYCWWYGNSSVNGTDQTHDVGGKLPNQWGLYDMSGNVWEWCWDWYGSYSSDAQTAPTGPATGTSRVLRGGSWDYDYDFICRSGYRNYSHPSYANYYFGFRVVRLRP